MKLRRKLRILDKEEDEPVAEASVGRQIRKVIVTEANCSTGRRRWFGRSFFSERLHLKRSCSAGSCWWVSLLNGVPAQAPASPEVSLQRSLGTQIRYVPSSASGDLPQHPAHRRIWPGTDLKASAWPSRECCVDGEATNFEREARRWRRLHAPVQGLGGE